MRDSTDQICNSPEKRQKSPIKSNLTKEIKLAKFSVLTGRTF